MRTWTACSLVLAVFWLWLPPTAEAGKDFEWDEVTAENWAVVEDSARHIFDAAIIFEKVTADDKKMDEQECYRTVYRRIRILNETGRKWADVQIPVWEAGQKVREVKGRTVLPDGSIVELNEDQVFKKAIIRVKKEKVEQSSFSLPGVTNDCIIEYMYKVETPSPVMTWVFQQDVAVLHAELDWKMAELTVPRILVGFVSGFITPNYLWLNTTKPPKLTKLPNIKEPTELLFEIEDTPPFEEEPFSLPAASLKQKLLCYYGSNEAAASFWGKQATGLEEGGKSFCESDKKLKKVVESFGEMETDKEKIEAAFNWLRDNITNVTYDEIDDERSKDKKKKKKIEPKHNKSVDDVVKHGYGTRSDIDYTFWDMLREMNIDARIGFVKDRTADLFVPSAKYWQFDRSVVAVKGDDGGYDFYCPGTACTCCGHVPWYDEGVEALVGGVEKYIIPVSFSPSSFTVNTHTFTLKVDEDLEVAGSLTARLTGHAARDIRIEVFNEEEAEFKDLIQDKFEEHFPNAEIDSLEFAGIDSLVSPVSVTCDLTYPALTEQAGRLLLKPISYMADSKNPFFATGRTGPVLFPYSYQLKESVTIELPDGWAVEALPSDTVFTNESGRCGVSFVAFGNSVSVQRVFDLAVPFWSANDYAVIKALYQTRQELADQLIVLKKAM